MQEANPLGTEKISKLLTKYSIPAIIGMLVNALYNIIDRIYIGNAPELGANGLAGITVAFPIMIILMAVGILFGQGGATLFSISLGRGDKEGADKVLGNALAMLLICGLSLLVLGQIFLEPLLRAFGASDTIMPYASEYLRVILFGTLFQVISMGMNNFLRADGQPRLAMLTMFFGAGTNIILDPIFIYGFKMGMSGAALATILSQCLSMVWILHYFLRRSPEHKLELRSMRLERARVIRITLLGLPGFFMQLGNSLLNVILNQTLLRYGGDIAISGMGVVNSIQTLLLMPLGGLNQGAQPIVSFNYGAGKYDRVKTAERLAILTATTIVLIGWIVTRLFPVQLVSLFNREPELLQFGSYAVRTWFWCLPVIGFQALGANFFQATGRPRIAILLTLSRQIILLIPAILVFSYFWGLDGLLYAAPFADGISACVTGVFFFFGIRRLSETGADKAAGVKQTAENS